MAQQVRRDERARRLKELETENARLKKLLAEQVLENEVIKDALRKCMVRPRSAMTAVVDEEQFAQMYPASRESATFGDQAMMRFARSVPNKRFGS